MVLACSDWIEKDLSSWYDAWDKIPLGFIIWHIQELSGTSNMRYALSGAMYIMLVHYSRGKKANREVSYSFVHRMLKAEGQMPRDIEKRESIEKGRELIEIRDTMPRGEWIEWVKDRAGYSYETVQRYMRMAREAKAA